MVNALIKLMENTFFKECQVESALAEFILNQPKLSMGEQTLKFEADFAQWHQRDYCVMVNSGSSANLVLLAALLNLERLKKGDRVGVSAVTWSTNVMPIIQLGLIPVLIDVESDDINISRRTVAQYGKDIKALFVTNVLGVQNHIIDIESYCREHDILLLEDNCEALGAKVGDQMLGNYGVASTSSSFVGHHFSTVEGGYIFCDDPELAAMCKVVRAHGWTRNLRNEEKVLLGCASVDSFNDAYTFEYCGFNVRPSELNALAGTLQLPYLEKFNKIRAERFDHASRKLCSNIYRGGEINPVFALPLRAESEKHRTKILADLSEGGIEFRPIISGSMGSQPFWSRIFGEQRMPNSQKVDCCGFYVSNDPQLDEDAFLYLIDALEKAFQ